MGFYSEVSSPFGQAYIVEQNEHITHLLFEKEELDSMKAQDPDLAHQETALLQLAKRQLTEYFRGKRKAFALPMHQEGTVFQKKVWEALLSIPYGESRSYSDIAEAIGHPKAVRAIGQANKKNALPIFIPCHRVIGKNNPQKVAGYAELFVKLHVLTKEQKDDIIQSIKNR